MNLDLFRGSGGLSLLMIDTALTLGFLLYPLFRRYHDDQGDGRGLVLIPPPRKVWQGRTLAFVVVFVTLDSVRITTIGNELNNAYAQAVTDLSGIALRAPARIADTLQSFSLGSRSVVVDTIVALALVIQADLPRRMLILAQALWFLAIMLCIDALFVVLTVTVGLPLSPGSFFAQVVALLIGVIVLLRTVFANFALPKGTELPLRKRIGTHHSAVMLAITVGSTVLAGAVGIAVLQATPAQDEAALLRILPLAVLAAAALLRNVIFTLIRLAGPPEPPAGDVRPPVEVMIPAFNEEEWIVGTLEAIDVAAGRYGGPVKIVMTDDGSTDRTKDLARETMDRFRYATGTIVRGTHGGKSAALNTALAACREDIIIRIDADTWIDEWCIYYAMRWFDDPTIGQIQAMVIPKKKRSFFAKMRLFETLPYYGFVVRAIQVVEAVNCAPGMFTAIRRQPLLDIGGFTLGMNGEDADITLSLSRIGYRTWLDPKVVIYEDVPPTYREFREQRIRWARASIHVFARHAPFRVGAFGTPRVWFSQSRAILGKLLAPIKLTAILYVVVTILMVPGGHALALRVVVWFSLAYVVAAAISIPMAEKFGVGRRVPWLALWLPFMLLRLVFGLEAILSLPPRPVHIPRLGRAPQAITEYVVH